MNIHEINALVDNHASGYLTPITIIVMVKDGQAYDMESGAKLNITGNVTLTGWGELSGRAYIVGSPYLCWSLRVPVNAWPAEYQA